MPAQMSLPFLENPLTNQEVWERLDNAQRALVLDKLAQLIAKSAGAEAQPEEPGPRLSLSRQGHRQRAGRPLPQHRLTISVDYGCSFMYCRTVTYESSDTFRSPPKGSPKTRTR